MREAMTDIHADDYGYSVNTSLDMLECMKAGKLDSISIIGNLAAFDECMDLFYQTIPELPFLPKLSIHLDLPEGEGVTDLVPVSWGKLFLASYGFSKEVRAKLKKELKWQIDKVQNAIDRCLAIARDNGIPCDQKGLRLDSHVHTHPLPIVWKALLELIEEENYAIEYIRNPKEPLLPFFSKPSLFSSYRIVNIIKNRILMFYSAKIDRYCDRKGLKKMYMCGLMMSGHMDRERVDSLYPALKKKADRDDRTLELLFHPGLALEKEYSDEKNSEYFTHFNSSSDRKVERDALMNSDILDSGVRNDS